MAVPAGSPDLEERIAGYLRTHHTMTVATCGCGEAGAAATTTATTTSAAASSGGGGVASAGMPHAASVFYAVDDALRLLFLSKPSSAHGVHIGNCAHVAATITEEYTDWNAIQGIQVWGEARRLTGRAEAQGLALYLKRFPFARELLSRPDRVALARDIGVYRVEPNRFAFTDNTTGVFGRELLLMME
ncbi:MAG: hypothetical protein ACOX8V_05755 [Thermoleophilia bacterium]|jgi:uncharacterized protein YhbP (UPF0306 family)